MSRDPGWSVFAFRSTTRFSCRRAQLRMVREARVDVRLIRPFIKARAYFIQFSFIAIAVVDVAARAGHLNAKSPSACGDGSTGPVSVF